MFISKRSNRYYYLFYFDDLGMRHKVSTGTTLKSEALKYLQRFTPEGHRRSRSRVCLPLSEFCTRYIEHAQARFSPKYQESISTSIRQFLTVTGDLPLRSIGVREIERFIATIAQGNSDRTVRTYFVTLASAFETARRWEQIDLNPFRKVQRPRLRELIPAHLTPAELAAVLNAESNRDLRDLYSCAVSTGMRLGELAALDWCDVDFVQRVILVRNTATFTTKNRRNRTIPMTVQLCGLLVARRNVSIAPYVFSFEGRRITKDIASRNFKQCITEAKLNPALHFHSLRHSFATLLVQSGVSIYAVQKLLGHSSVAMTQVYSHLAPSDLHDAVGVTSLPVAAD